MNKEILYEILNSKSEKLSSIEIENILNEELDKAPEEMDTNLIDLCLDALNNIHEKKINKKRRKISISKILLVAVVFILVIGICIPACANYFSIDVPDGIVTFYNNCFNVDISNDKYINDILNQLEQDDIIDAVLPEIIFSSETQISNYARNDTENYMMINFNFNNSEIEGHITIQEYVNNYDFVTERSKANSEFDNVKYFNIIVFNEGNNSQINYVVNNTEYNIVIDCDYETACQIAKTI
jgi:hypothetical protein